MKKIVSHKKITKELRQHIYKYHKKGTPQERYASYDFCYGYFQKNHHHLGDNMELSCLHLWSYLASWGMLRGSSMLLKECSMKVLSKVIEYLDRLPDEVWNYDVDNYCDDTVCDKILDVVKNIKKRLSDIKIKKSSSIVSPTNTLVTKIMLGTLGCIPAFDDNFTKTFKKEYISKTEYIYQEKKYSISCAFTNIDIKSIKCIYNFYSENQNALNKMHIPVIDFYNHKLDIEYKKAKLIDMYGFTVGINLRESNDI